MRQNSIVQRCRRPVVQIRPCPPDVTQRGNVDTCERGPKPLSAARLQRADVQQSQCSRVGEGGSTMATCTVLRLKHVTTGAAVRGKGPSCTAVWTGLEGVE